MPKGSEALTNARKEEIINACASLYETMSFKAITIRDIGAHTSFTRTSIYNYFQTKEEIFLALLQREHEQWTADLQALIRQHASLSAETFADCLAHTLEKRSRMLKLMSMNLYEMEENSRLENLVALKCAFADALQAVEDCLIKFFPSMDANDRQAVLYAFLPFLLGVYPYTSHTEKQLQAMQLAHMQAVPYSIFQLSQSFLIKILKPFDAQADDGRS